MKQERMLCYDIVRAFAVVMVIAVHFFLNTGFYDLPLQGATMALCTWMRMVLMVCVPLFLMLSGYFCADRRWSARHLRGLASVLLIYLMASALCLLFRGLWLKETMSVGGVILMLLDFSAAPYGWYVEMYAGLYLLMPLFNMGWKGLDARGRRAALIVLLLLTSLPTVTNAFGYQILTDWWLQLYPAMYYLLGVWLREDHPKLDRVRGVWLLLIWFLIAAAVAGIRWVTAKGANFTWTVYTDFQSPFFVAESVCAFVLLRRLKGARLPAWGKRAVSGAAQLSLPIFLLSYIFDTLFYPVLNRSIASLKGRLPFLPLMVIAVLLCSALLGKPLDLAARALVRGAAERNEENRTGGETSDEH